MLQQREDTVEAWLQQAQAVLDDNEDDAESLIKKHKTFFGRADQKMMDDYLRAGQDILMVLDEPDRIDLQQSIARLENKYKVWLEIGH